MRLRLRPAPRSRRRASSHGTKATPAPCSTVAGAVPIGEVQWRQHARVSGRVRSVRVQPWAGVPTLECTLVDGTGGVDVVFLGRREVAGIRPGTRLTAEGILGAHHGRLALLNPAYELMA